MSKNQIHDLNFSSKATYWLKGAMRCWTWCLSSAVCFSCPIRLECCKRAASCLLTIWSAHFCLPFLKTFFFFGYLICSRISYTKSDLGYMFLRVAVFTLIFSSLSQGRLPIYFLDDRSKACKHYNYQLQDNQENCALTLKDKWEFQLCSYLTLIWIYRCLFKFSHSSQPQAHVSFSQSRLFHRWKFSYQHA